LYVVLMHLHLHPSLLLLLFILDVPLLAFHCQVSLSLPLFVLLVGYHENNLTEGRHIIIPTMSFPVPCMSDSWHNIWILTSDHWVRNNRKS
jgi:hypothetical protein